MYGGFLAILGIAALLGQREAWLILLLWIAWPILKLLPKAFNLRKKEAPIEGKVLEVQGVSPSTRPALPDPDTVDVEWKPVSTSKWRTAFAAVIAAIGGLLFLGGAISLVLTLLR